ncbi:hypothetical protein EBR57_03250 [bacterium]|nr:hypothetical protein [bacterium]
MSTLSSRAFEEAQRRRLYPDRHGALGVACLQRDLFLATREIALASEYLWKKEKTDIATASEFGLTDTQRLRKMGFHHHLAEAVTYLLQASGSTGVDLLSMVKAEIEKKELSIV